MPNKEKHEAEKTTHSIEELTAKVDELTAEKDRLNDSYLRLAAEYDNYKKRQAKNFGEMVSVARDALILKVLDILDNFERAIVSSEKPPSVESLMEGIHLIHKQIQDMLASENIETVGEVGDEFDPNLHEAVALVPSDKEENTVVEVLQKGYRCGERLIRPAKVLVSVPKNKEGEKDN